jgi:hypothetical protein
MACIKGKGAIFENSELQIGVIKELIYNGLA